MDTKTLLKNILLSLREQGKAHKASAIAMYASLVKYAFLEDGLTKGEIAALCNIDPSTLRRNASFCFKLPHANVDEWSKLPENGANCLKNEHSASSPTKERERERESSPQTPFIEKGKGKENVCADRTQSHTHDSSVPQKKAKGQRREGRHEKTPPETPVVLRYPKEFNRFYKHYPKKTGIKGKGKEVLKRAWYQCEQDGWPGEIINQALDAAICSERWTEKDGLYKPNAIKFLEEELMRDFLPIGYTPQPLVVEVPAEEEPPEATNGMVYKLGAWWTPEELKDYAERLIIPERLKDTIGL